MEGDGFFPWATKAPLQFRRKLRPIGYALLEKTDEQLCRDVPGSARQQVARISGINEYSLKKF